MVRPVVMPSRRSPPLWRQLESAAAVLAGVERGRSLADLLPAVPAELRSATQALSFEALRRWGTTSALVRLLARRPPAPEPRALLRLSLALLLPEQPGRGAHTVVDQTVRAAAATASSQRGFINACLRRFLRERESLLHMLAGDLAAQWNHPVWWVRRLQQDHPRHWQVLLRANQRPAALDLRVNALRLHGSAYRSQLQAAGLDGELLGPQTLRLAPRPARDLPGLDEGLVSVQSRAAQLAAPLLLQGLSRRAPSILDACAAPGGKTTHLLELCPQAQVTALDKDADRCQRIHDNLHRLGLQARVQVADAARPQDWHDGRSRFDAILLDAPCSASGIAGRHPDVRWLRRASDLQRLARQQDRLLRGLWPLLAPGGRLLYCTCSAFSVEGAERVAAFLAAHADARPLPAPGHVLGALSPAAVATGDNPFNDSDCFYYALLLKQPTS